MVTKNLGGIRRTSSQLQSYYDKIKEMNDRIQELENEYAIKVGQLVLKELGNDVDELESFMEWLELYKADKPSSTNGQEMEEQVDTEVG